MITNQIKSLLKRFLPPPLLAVARRLRAGYAERSVAGLSVEDTFDKIYRQGFWGHGMSSGAGSHGHTADEFVRVIREIIDQEHIRSIADLGCGEFSIGSRLAGHVERYAAYDVSKVILERNRGRFAHLANTTFQHLNIIEEIPEPADLVIIRQVLQHLTNTQIETALRNLEQTQSNMIIVADEIIRQDTGQDINIDLVQQSVGTRANSGHGLYLDRPPFNRKVRLIEDIPETDGSLSTLRVVELVRD